VRRPQSNGYVERLHRTLLDEHFRVMGRTKFYEGNTRYRPTWTPTSSPTTLSVPTKAAR